MKLRTKLYLSSLITICLIAIFLLLIFISSNDVNKHNRERAASRNILQGVSELDILAHEYSLHHEKRVKEQWSLRYDSLKKRFSDIQPEEDETTIVNRLLKNYSIVGSSFSKLVANYERNRKLIREKSPEGISAASATEDGMMAQLLIASQSMVSDASILAEKNVSDLLNAQTLARNLALSMGLILLVNGVIAVLTITRSVSKSLHMLQLGAKEIGRGNLDYKIEINNRDEIGQVARTFNKMTNNLRTTITTKADLEKEISERKEAENRMNEVIDVTGAGYYEHTADSSSGLISERFARILGFRLKELPKYPAFAKWLVKRIHKEDLEMFKMHVDDFRRGGIARFDHEYRVLAKNGKWLWLHFISTSLQKNAHGHPLYIAGLVFDVTERRKTEETLRESEKKLNKSQEIARLGYWELEFGSNHLQWSDEEYRIYGFRPKEVTPSSKVFYNIVHPEDRKMVANTYIDSIKKGKSDYECTFRIINKTTGEIRILREKSEHVYDKSGKVVRTIGMTQDITEQKHVEDALRKSEEKFRSVAETAKDAIISADSRGNIIYFNRGAEQTFGYATAEVMGKPLIILMPEKFRTSHQHGFSRFLESGKPHVIGKTIELKGRKKDGKEFPIELSLAAWRVNNESFFTAIIRDITQRKSLDQRKDDFITIAGHELRTPVSAIKMMNQMLQDILADNPQAKKYLKKIEQQANIQADLINDLLSVSRIQTGKLEIRKEPFTLQSLVKETAGYMQKTTKTHKIIVKGKIYAKILADKDRVRQVLVNFFSNAIKFSPKGGKIIAEVKTDKKGAVVGVTDFGVGIPKEHQDRIFDRFYRVYGSGNKTYPGLGMGLYISYQIIKLHKGQMWFESTSGKGSTFYFSIPFSKK